MGSGAVQHPSVKKVAIIGGGISGLSAAVLLEEARRRGAPIEYALFEATPRLGGVLRTERVEDCVVEAGPDSFLTEKAWALDFCRKLGLDDQLIGSNDSERKTYIAVRGKLVAMPDGLQFMVPTRILPILFTPLFSLRTKLRMAREFLFRPRPAPADGEDESAAQLVERHFGREMVERLADPLLAGIYGASADSLSAAAALPRFVEMERRYGSLTRGMLQARKRSTQDSSAPAPPLFTSLRGGMQQMADAAAAQLHPAAARTSNPVRALQRERDGWRIIARDCATEIFSGVILATPAPAAGALLEDVDTRLASELRQIPYSSSITLALGYERRAFTSAPPGFGFLVPRSEQRRILACTFVHTKFPHRAPPDKALVRCFLGGSQDEGALELSDTELVDIIRRELSQLAHIRAEPRFVRIYRWRGAMALYAPGHRARTDRIERLRSEHAALELAGNAYHGIGVPDCIASGHLAALNSLTSLGLARAELRGAWPSVR